MALVLRAISAAQSCLGAIQECRENHARPCLTDFGFAAFK